MLAALLLAWAPAAHAAEDAIPRPPELERDVQFWIRVYTQVTTNEGLLHDEHNLAAVYERVSFGVNATPQQRRNQLDAARDKISASLKRLAAGGSDLTAEDQRIAALFGGEASPARFRQAQDEIRFQLGQADRFRQGLVRSGTWEGHIAQSVANQGLPPEIAALPHVESSFDPTAYSKVGAAGLWQFMRSTGRRFLRIDDAVDERFDPFRASEAAAQLLDFNYRLLGSWPLALTAYNHGAGGMRRARDQMGTTDIVRIVREYKSPLFGFASRNFYVSFLAALEIDRNPEKYFGPLARASEVRFHEVQMPAYVPVASVERLTRIPRDTLKEMNPALRSTVWNGQRLVPKGYKLRLPAEASEWNTSLLAARLAATEQYASQPRPRSQRVRQGDTLASIAAANNVTAAELARLNRLAANAKLRAGRTVLLPEAQPALARAATVAPAQPPPGRTYVVRAGDTLSDIATRQGVPEQTLTVLNQLRSADAIYEGQRLRLTTDAPPQSEVTAAVAIADKGPAAEKASKALLAEKEEETKVAAAEARPERPANEPVSAAQAQAESPALAPGNPVPQATDPVDYAVADNDTIRVVAAETIGHYADWLGITAQRLRDLNNLKIKNPVVMGRSVKLDFAKVPKATFEQRRREYHQKLQAAFFEEHRITGTEVYISRRGDSLWSVTQRYTNLPVWLLQQYNLDIDFADLRAGMKIVVPLVENVAGV